MNHLDLNKLVLSAGSHAPNDKGQMCQMEAVAYFAHEPWSDRPQCASPVLTNFMISWNDYSDDEQRQELKRYIPALVGSKANEATELRRSWMAFDWLVRVHAPAWLRLAGLTEHADRLASAPELVDQASLDAIREGLTVAQTGAAAAGDAARNALQPTVDELRTSAHQLVERMLALTPAKAAS